MTIECVERAHTHGERVAIVDVGGARTYRELYDASARVAAALLAGRDSLDGGRVAFMVGPGFDYAAVLYGIWRAGGVAVPLSPAHPVPEVEYILDDTSAESIVGDVASEHRLETLASARDAYFLRSTEAIAGRGTSAVPRHRDSALILYTSGTTSRPKGVVLTHDNLRAQIVSLVTAWEWRASDRIVHVLPLHHTHGIVNALLCPLWTGATCEMQRGFDARRVWTRLAAGEGERDRAGEGPTVFMAVPTIYAKLIAEWERAEEGERQRWARGAGRLRLMVSGSAALPVSVFARWREITGQTLLERYGMTEIGMALSNPLHGERRAGTVGMPLPGVEVERRDERGAPVASDEVPAELYVRGASVFREYWRRPEATAAAFHDGWFRTGDIAVLDAGYYRILGRSSVDIIKTGGYKVSALEIEDALREHPAVTDCAVVAIADAEWGERICAAVVAPFRSALADELSVWLAGRIAPYKLPRRWTFVDALPRNAMGKVVKSDVKKLFAPGDSDPQGEHRLP